MTAEATLPETSSEVLRVGDLMHGGIVSCARISEVADVMVHSGAHRVVVIDPDDLQPIGMLSTTDIAFAFLPKR